MQLSTAVWSLILLAVLAANLPFVNQRLFVVFRLGDSSKKKLFWLRLLELVIYYGMLAVIAYWLESSIGNVFAQRWEFFVITACIFVVLAFPGFVFQYLRRKHNF